MHSSSKLQKLRCLGYLLTYNFRAVGRSFLNDVIAAATIWQVFNGHSRDTDDVGFGCIDDDGPQVCRYLQVMSRCKWMMVVTMQLPTKLPLLLLWI